MPPRKRNHHIDLPGHLSDESAAEILDFLYHLTATFESRYFAQIHRYYDNLRADRMSCVPAQGHPAPDPNDPQADPF
ncbi:MAG: hypothetical protein IPI75_05310 [Gammaproteobacteria bacterium]|jgi:hypothetical protein|nr:hypothetical protein [Gammaproteobacteria bacterium]MBK7169259.1 hypothetical protein [Gammaproteobacteria bacterium]MBK7519561.1 hypothetical protein [Gammaproteobacteria bacterium]MBK8308391.1 hypothetical protein [Gammaproteobacteria bacterium]MBK9665541.1 hypothetical protein [Gammaproteobacteria bacterium]